MYFGSNLKVLLKRIPITQTSLANTLNVGNSTVSAWISGNSKPEVDTLLEIRKIVGEDLERLFFHDFSREVNIKNSLEANILNEPQVDYGENGERIVYQQLTTYIERECAATGGGCYFEQLKVANAKIAALEKKLEEKK